MLLVMMGAFSICLLYQAIGLKLRLPRAFPGKHPTLGLAYTARRPLPPESLPTNAKAAIVLPDFRGGAEIANTLTSRPKIMVVGGAEKLQTKHFDVTAAVCLFL